jgi:hypothetical protein
MSIEELTALCGVVTSLIFSYFPIVRDWFDAQEPNVKRLLQVAVAVVVSGAVFGLSCAGILGGFSCDWPGALDAVRLIVIFVVANQTAYAVTPRK